MKKGLIFLIMFIILATLSYAQTAWYDGNFTTRIQLNFTEIKGLDRINEPVYLNLSALNPLCYAANKSDLRIIRSSDKAEIPYQFIEGGNRIFMEINISASASGEYGYIYCNNTLVGQANYISPMSYVMGAKCLKINPGDKWDSSYGFCGGLGNISAINGTNISLASGIMGFRNNGGQYLYYHTTAGSCYIAESGALLVRYSCNQTFRIMTYDFYAYNPLYRLVDSYSIQLEHLWSQFGGGASVLPQNIEGYKYMDTSGGVTNKTGTTNCEADLYFGHGAFEFFQSEYNSFSLFFNESHLQKINPLSNNSYRHMQSYNDWYIGIGSNDDACAGTSSDIYLNASDLGSESGRTFMGFASANDRIFNETYLITQNPINMVLGSEENWTAPHSLNRTSQLPSDITALNIVNSGVQINFTVYGVNASNLTLWYIVNSSLDANMYYVNGTAYGGWIPRKCTTLLSGNISNTCLLKDTELLPATYNYNETWTESKFHNITLTLNSGDYFKVMFTNVSDKTSFDYFEIMSNISVNPPVNQQLIYYCNSSYITGKVETSPNCGFAGVMPLTYNHTHIPGFASHKMIGIVINVTTGKISGIKVTPTSYFILKGTNGNSNMFYYGIGGDGDFKVYTSTNAGATYNYQNAIYDAHLHQFTNETLLTYYASEGGFQSSIYTDIFDIGGLPPIGVFVYPVPNMTTTQIYRINYTTSGSPNGYSVSYNVSLFNSTYAYLQEIIYTNNPYVDYNSSISGLFYIGVKAVDAIGQESEWGYSNLFNSSLTGIGKAIVIAPNSIVANTTLYLNWTNCSQGSGVQDYINITLTNWDNLTIFSIAKLDYYTFTQYAFNASYNWGNYTANVTCHDTYDYVSSASSNLFTITDVCHSSFNCSTSYCNSFNVSICTSVIDSACGVPFTGNLSDYNGNCTYIPPGIYLNKFDLSGQEGQTLFFIFVIMWVAFLIAGFAMKSLPLTIIATCIGFIVGLMIMATIVIAGILITLVNIAVSITAASQFRH